MRDRRQRALMNAPSAVLLLVLLAGCQGDTEAPAAAAPASFDDPQVLAAWLGGTIRIDDLDRHLLAKRPLARLAPPDRSQKEWLEEQLMQLFELELAQEDEALFVEESWEVARRPLLVDALLRLETAGDRTTREEARAIFDRYRDRAKTPERRILSNILIAYPEGADAGGREQACARAEALRGDIAAGLSFETAAREHSDSRTAAAGGEIGVVQRASLRGEVREEVFSLEPGRVSRVIPTPAGCQLFFVRAILPATEIDFEEALPQILEQLRQQKTQALIARLLDEESERTSTPLPDFDDPAAAPEFPGLTPQALASARTRSTTPRQAFGQAVAELMLSRRMLDLHPDEAERALATPKRDALLDWHRRRQRLEWVERIPEAELLEFFEQRRSQFVSQPGIELTVLTWRLEPGDPVAQMQEPRRVAGALRAGGDLEAVWSEIEEVASRERLPLTDFRSLPSLHPRLSVLIGQSFEQGDVLGPARSGDTIVLARVENWVPSRPLAFAEALDLVRSEYARLHRSVIEEERLAALREEHQLVLNEEGLEQFGGRLLERLLTASPGEAG